LLFSHPLQQAPQQALNSIDDAEESIRFMTAMREKLPQLPQNNLVRVFVSFFFFPLN
jgi:hypothetical protein